MWEKLSSDGTIHDWSALYPWTTAYTTKIAALNAASFASHADWRLPNVNELQTLVEYGHANPAVDTAFNTGCVPACSVTGCSCTASSTYWSSTTNQNNTDNAWNVNFNNGNVNANDKTNNNRVRAVRGGS